MDGLERFVVAQEEVWASVQAELRTGRKTSHWMWFVFPQLRELGRSSTAQYYGLAGLDEAIAYLRHPLLGERLRVCTALVLAHRGRSVHAIFGSPDDLKLRSCMTLFERVDPADAAFADLLDAFYAGERDPLTLAALDRR